MKHIKLIIAVLMGAASALAAPTLEKDPIQGLVGSLGPTASVSLKTLNISAPGPDPEPSSISMLVDRARMKTRDPSYVYCDLFGHPIGPYYTAPDKVRKNMDQLRARSDKPSTVAAGECETAICSDNSVIGWCVNATNSGNYTVESWGLLADAAQATLNTCSPDDTDFNGAAIYNDIWYALVLPCKKEN